MEAAIGRAAVTVEDVYPSFLLEALAPLVERPNDIDLEVVREFLHLIPSEIEKEVLQAEYRMGSFLPEFKFAYQSDRSTLKIAQRLFAERPVDVAAVYLLGIDTVSHLFWHFTYPHEFSGQLVQPHDVERFGRVIPQYYELMDEYLESLLGMLGSGTTVILVSDHGFGGTGQLPWSGGHGRLTPGAPIAPKGVLVLSGPGVVRGVHLAQAHVLDVLPTLLRLLGLPAAEDMLGRVLAEALLLEGAGELPRVASYETIGKLRTSGEIPVDPAGDAERLERLRALGYVQ
jgi:hypothetical protein